MLGATCLTLALLHINLVPEHNEREVLRVVWAGLDKELVAPAVEGLEGLGAVDVVHEHAAIRPTVECHPQRLETFLTRGIPQLPTPQGIIRSREDISTYLHGHKAVVHHDFLR